MGYNINVIGAGVCGLSSALLIAKKFPDSEITVLSASWHPYTTSDHGFGIVALRTLECVDDLANTKGYVMETLKFCQSCVREDAEKMGIRLLKCIAVTQEKDDDEKENAKLLKSTTFGMRNASSEEITALGLQKSLFYRLFENFSPEHIFVYLGHAFVIDTSIYLPWMQAQLKSLTHSDGRKRVRFVTKRISSLNVVASCDLVINCAGLGADDFVNDSLLFPIRGQYLRLDAPHQNHLLLLNHTFIVPRYNNVAVGSVYQNYKSHTNIVDEDTEDILNRVEVGFPLVRRATVLKVDVGIRPARIGGPRVEVDFLPNKTPLVHNYGHGPRGIAQHYGTALRVCDLAANVLEQKSLL